MAGIAGSGQKELCEVIAGLYPSIGGSVLYNGSNDDGEVKERILGLKPDEIVKKGFLWRLCRRTGWEWVWSPTWI